MSQQIASQKAVNENPMRKIISMVAIAIIVFLAFTAYSVHKSVQSNAQLTAIKILFFPVLEHVDANIVRLDKMEEQYLQAAMTGERDMLDKATDIYAQADKTFEEMVRLYPEREKDTMKLRADFRSYKEMATATLTALLKNSKEANLIEQTQEMNKVLNALRKNIIHFRESSYGNFVATLEDSQQAVRVNLYMGTALGVMNLLFMGVLVFFIRNNVEMMRVIAEQNATLERRVAERTAQLSQKTNDINAMLQNMNLGVCTVVPGNRIHPEYSEYMRTIFCIEDFAQKDVLESLFADSSLGLDIKDQVETALSAIIGEDSMVFDFNSHLLVGEMQVNDGSGEPKTLQLNWSPIKNDDNIVEKVLIIVQDVTHLRALELASAKQQEELKIISQIINTPPHKFDGFVASSQKLIAENLKLITNLKGSPDKELIAALFRNMHTIKGNARTYEFILIANAAHTAEQEYDRLRKENQSLWDADRVLAELKTVDAAIEHYLEINIGKLGRTKQDTWQSTTEGVYVAYEEMAKIQSLVASLAQEGANVKVERLQQSISQLGLVPLQRLLSDTVDSLSSVAAELGKPTPSVHIIGDDIAFNKPCVEALRNCFMHIFRNSLDHGIESPIERVSVNKPERGEIRVVNAQFGDHVELHISDDGRGLALHKLYQKGVENGLFTPEESPEPDRVAELIFHSGLSTAEQLTQVSGRGVGMDAVRVFLNELGANIHIVLNSLDRKLGFTPFKFVISLPLNTTTLALHCYTQQQYQHADETQRTAAPMILEVAAQHYVEKIGA